MRSGEREKKKNLMQLENAIEKKMKRNPKASAIVRGGVHRKTTACRL